MARIKRLRLQSFMLNPPDEGSATKTNNIDDSDKKNNNYLSARLSKEDAEAIDAMDQTRSRSLSDIKRDFQLDDIADFVHKGLEVSSMINFEFKLRLKCYI